MVIAVTAQPVPLSPFHFRQMADSLRAFSVESALRQIDLHEQMRHVTVQDANALRNVVRDTRLWLY